MATVDEASGQADLQHLLTLYNAGKFAAAEQRAKALIERFPGALILRNILGASLLDQGKFADAVDCFRGALEREPKSPEGHNNLGIAQQRLGAFEEAAASYREAVALKPDYADAHNNLGVVLADLGQVDNAIECYQSALMHTPDFAEAHNNLGAAFAEIEKYEFAANAYRQALQNNPNYAEAHNNLGIVLRKQRSWDDALACFRLALEIAPRYAAAYNNLGNALQELGRLDEALESYQTALDVEPSLPQTLNNLGNVYRLLDRFDDSIDIFTKLLEADPDNAETHNNLGVAYKESGEIDEAMRSYRNALDLKPDFVDAQINLGGALLGEEQIDAAIESYRAADPQNLSHKISALILECYYRKGDKTAFDIQLQIIKAKQEGYNFRAGAAAAFVAHQYGTRNAYQFCEDPIANVTTFNLFEEGAIDETVVKALETAVNESGGNERFAPGHISSGFKSVGNLFNKNIGQFDDLNVLIRRYIAKYRDLHQDEGDLFIEGWPKDYALDGWYIRLLKGGEITAHIHSAWLSGILYLKVPDKKGGDEGNIEFTLRGYELPVQRDDYPRKTVDTFSGALVLFPSSLPHRVIPFTSDEERICIPFDAVPN